MKEQASIYILDVDTKSLDCRDICQHVEIYKPDRDKYVSTHDKRIDDRHGGDGIHKGFKDQNAMVCKESDSIFTD